MKDIRAILEGFQLTDEERETIVREVGENYRSIVEVTKKAQRIEELEQQNKALTEQVGNLEGDGEELQSLREKVDAFARAEEKRRADELEAEKRESFRALFDNALGDREFANEMIRDSVFAKAYEKCSDATGYDAGKAIEELTENKDGIWKNPQRAAEKMPNQNDISSNKEREEKSDAKAIAHFMFGKRK